MTGHKPAVKKKAQGTIKVFKAAEEAAVKMLITVSKKTHRIL